MVICDPSSVEPYVARTGNPAIERPRELRHSDGSAAHEHGAQCSRLLDVVELRSDEAGVGDPVEREGLPPGRRERDCPAPDERPEQECEPADVMEGKRRGPAIAGSEGTRVSAPSAARAKRRDAVRHGTGRPVEPDVSTRIAVSPAGPSPNWARPCRAVDRRGRGGTRFCRPRQMLASATANAGSGVATSPTTRRSPRDRASRARSQSRKLIVSVAETKAGASPNRCAASWRRSLTPGARARTSAARVARASVKPCAVSSSGVS